MTEGFQMAEMLTQSLELVKVPSFNPGIIGSSSNYVVRCTKCGRTQEINADFWKDYVQHPYCKYCDQY